MLDFSTRTSPLLSTARLLIERAASTLQPSAEQATLGAGRDLTLQATLQGAAGSNEPIAGYTIELFYP